MAQLVLAFMWGIVSDRCGRKPLIIMSNFFSTISMLMFGLSGNYMAAALARILGGACVPPPCMTSLIADSDMPTLLMCLPRIFAGRSLTIPEHSTFRQSSLLQGRRWTPIGGPHTCKVCRFNSSFTNVKCMLAESTDFSSQTVAMGYLGTAYGFGAILGPVIGGALAFPCDALGPNVPWCGEGELNAVRCGGQPSRNLPLLLHAVTDNEPPKWCLPVAMSPL